MNIEYFDVIFSHTFSVNVWENDLINRCSLRVEPNEGICQLRIEFLDFSLAQPSGDGICNTDVFSVSGGASNVPSLCGENSGQHVIVDFSDKSPILLTIKATATYTYGRHWNIRVAQIGCDSENKGRYIYKINILIQCNLLSIVSF